MDLLVLEEEILLGIPQILVMIMEDEDEADMGEVPVVIAMEDEVLIMFSQILPINR
jgi:hypothetical protein